VTKKDMVIGIADRLGWSQTQASEALEASLAEISNAIMKGENVVVRGFGSFEIRQRAERIGRNPGNGEKIVIPAKKKVVFKPSGAILEKLNK
jgi:nucleoid DNA-binding protein